MNMQATNATEASIKVVVSRCTCGNPQSHLPEPCPVGRLEDHGTISYWSRNRIKRWLWAAKNRR